MLGVGLAVGLWADRLAVDGDAFDRRMIAWSRRLLIALGLVLIAATPLAVVYAHATAISYAPIAVGACIVIGSIAVLFRYPLSFASGHSRKSLAACYASYVFIFLGGALIYFPAVNARSDLASIAAALHVDLRNRPLILVHPDETTRAFVDLGGIAATVANAGVSRPEDELQAALNQAAPDACLLVMLKNGGGPLSDLMVQYGHRSRAKGAGIDTNTLAAASAMHIESEYALPEGRRYALLARNAPRSPS
jgi:hypothetical protein